MPPSSGQPGLTLAILPSPGVSSGPNPRPREVPSSGEIGVGTVTWIIGVALGYDAASGGVPSWTAPISPLPWMKLYTPFLRMRGSVLSPTIVLDASDSGWQAGVCVCVHVLVETYRKSVVGPESRSSLLLPVEAASCAAGVCMLSCLTAFNRSSLSFSVRALASFFISLNFFSSSNLCFSRPFLLKDMRDFLFEFCATPLPAARRSSVRYVRGFPLPPPPPSM
mmetsp:Transcript_71473/g.201698  ORF Transcript_71473/g.201698 Transcript_71473/m.201698 type:complete len:223 (-) Transcript_71473:646-1314(-)